MYQSHNSAELAGFWDWLTKPIFIQGVTDTALERHFATQYAAWVTATRAAGRFPTRMPSGPSAGQLAERYTDRSGTARYMLAPTALRDLEAKIVRMEGGQQRAAAITTRIQDTLKDTATGVLALPRNAAGAILGIPPWMVTALVLGGGLLLARAILPDVKARVRSGR